MQRRTVILGLIPAVAFSGIALAASKAGKQAEVRKAAQAALSALCKVQIAARAAMESAAGYAAFSNFGMKILLAGSGKGEGLAVNNKTKATAYMKLVELQAGLGWPGHWGQEVSTGLGV